MSDPVVSLLTLLEKNRHIEFTRAQLPLYRKRISQWLTAHQITDLETLMQQLSRDRDYCNQLIDWLLIKASYFFRNCQVFELIRQVLLPDILERKLASGSRVLRIWSAGCATGEEPYSLAMLIKEYLNLTEDRYRLHIFGTDISDSALSQAVTGEYSKDKLLETKLRYLETYFTGKGDHYQLDQSIRDLVHFSKHDLLASSQFTPPDSVFGSFDLVVCRNVLIYYSEQKQKQISEMLLQSLDKGGYLIIGKAETLPARQTSRVKTVDQRNRIYLNLC